MKAYQLKITARYTNPSVWRRIIVPADLSFAQLSVVLNEAMGWFGEHLYSFEFPDLQLRLEELNENYDYFFENMDVDDSSEIMLEAYLDLENRFTYVYDFGNEWRYTVVVEKTLTDYDRNYPAILKYRGDTPCQDNIHEMYDLKKVNQKLKKMSLTGIKSKPMTQEEIYDSLEKGKGFFNVQGNYLGIYDWDEEDDAEILRSNPDLQDELENIWMRIQDSGQDIKSLRADVRLQDIFMDYNKENLIEIAKLHHLKGYSRLNKEELIRFLASKLLEKDTMCAYFSYLTDEEISIIDKFSKPVSRLKTGEEEISRGIALVSGGYAGASCLGYIVIPEEVRQAYHKNCRDKEWNDERQKKQELAIYLNGAAELYGICPVENALEIYTKYTGKSAQADEIQEFCKPIPENKKDYIYDNNRLIHKSFVREEDRQELERVQKGKHYYMPSRQEIETLGKEGYLPFDSSMKALRSFFTDFLKGDGGYAEDLCRYMQRVIREGGTIQEIIEFLSGVDVLDEFCDRKTIEKVKQLLHNVWNRTRKMQNRGNMSEKNVRQQKSTGNIVNFPADLSKWRNN